MDRVTLYSNGTGLFDRGYALSAGETLHVSIPIRNDSLDEAIASIGVFGDVTILEPPNYTPLGSSLTNLSLSPNNVARELAMRLRGAHVQVKLADERVEGRIVGIQELPDVVGDQILERFGVVLLDAAGALITIPDREMRSLTFTEDSVQSEIDKFLRQQFETIRPESTLLNLSIAPRTPDVNEARIQYAVAQMGAWKLSYRLYAYEGTWRLDGQAVVDNSTDEPWDNVIISVVTGEPISFATDLAELRPVSRSKVNLIADYAVGAVSASTVLDYVPAYDASDLPLDSGRSTSRKSLARQATFGAFAPPPMAAYGMAMPAPAPVSPEVMEAREIGDAIAYTTAEPVSIGANKSAVIPVLSTLLDESRELLLYRPEQRRDRAFRAVRFTNNTGQSLGRGVCTLFRDNLYVGKAILEPTQSGEERTLPYALESSVVIQRILWPMEIPRLQVRVSNGVAVDTRSRRLQTTYQIRNNGTTGFTLEIEHPGQFPGGAGTAVARPERQISKRTIVSGTRLSLELEAKESLEIDVIEQSPFEQHITLQGEEGANWLTQNLVSSRRPLMEDPALQTCLERQADLARAKKALADSDQMLQDLLDEQQRLMSLLEAGGHEGAAGEWRSTLAENERAIKTEKRENVPALRQAIAAAEAALQNALSSLILVWKEPGEESIDG